MSEVDLAAVTRVAAAWGLRPTRAVVLRDGVFRLETPRGPYCLKRVRQPVGTVAFVRDALNQLDEMGFHQISRFIPTRRGRPGLEDGGRTWVLVEWIEGHKPDVKNREDLRQSALTLARFHRAALGLRPRHGSIPQDYLGKWPAIFREVRRDIYRATSRAFLNEHPFLAKPLSAHAVWLRRQADAALRLLAHAQYPRLVAQRRTEKGFCHGDSGGGNFVIAPDGTATLIDFETLRYDLRIYDLYRLIRRSIKRTGWQAETARWILENYNRENRVEPAELSLLLAWLYLPIKFRRLIHRATVLKGGPERNRAVRRLTRHLGRREELGRFLNDFGQSLDVKA